MTTELEIVDLSPKADVDSGRKIANELMKLVKEKGLAKNFGGEKDHLMVEAWQALGRLTRFFAGEPTVEPVEVEGVTGAKATVTLFDEDGNMAGGGVAYCMRDEPNWKPKSWFNLASMAQTRAVSKAFRNRLGWIARLAGYEATPAEEMDGIRVEPPKQSTPRQEQPQPAQTAASASQKQIKYIESLCQEKSIGLMKVLGEYGVTSLKELTKYQASELIKQLQENPNDIPM